MCLCPGLKFSILVSICGKEGGNTEDCKVSYFYETEYLQSTWSDGIALICIQLKSIQQMDI